MGIPLPDQGTVTEDTDVVGGLLVVSGDAQVFFGLNGPGSFVAGSFTGLYGSTLVIDSAGVWTYTANNANAAIQALNTGESLQEVFVVTTPSGFSTTITITIEGQDEVPCFVAGTPIDTPAGPRPVEALRVGDLVLTRDHGPQPLQWVGAREVILDASPEARRLRPIRIRAGALGPGAPAQDILVSPMHRVLIAHPMAELLCGAPEVFCPARRLVNGQSIHSEHPAQLRYYHLLFERHEVVTSAGMASESLYLGDVARIGFADAAREELLALFPDLSAAGWFGQTARPVAKHYEAAMLAELLRPQDALPARLSGRLFGRFPQVA